MVENKYLDAILHTGSKVFCHVSENGKCSIFEIVKPLGDGKYLTSYGTEVYNVSMIWAERLKYSVYKNKIYKWISPCESDFTKSLVGQVCLFAEKITETDFSVGVLSAYTNDYFQTKVTRLSEPTEFSRSWNFMAYCIGTVLQMEYKISFADKNGKLQFSVNLTKSEWQEISDRIQSKIRDME